jgi:hypothetical protein
VNPSSSTPIKAKFLRTSRPAQRHFSLSTNAMATVRADFGSVCKIGSVLILLSISLTSCAPQKKHDHAIFGPTDKGSGTEYGNHDP